MKLRKSFTAAVFGLLTISAPAAELIPATGMTATARDWYATREPGKVLNGLSSGGGFTDDNTVYLGGGSDPNNPADYRLDATAGGNTAFGQNVSWSDNNGTNNWIQVDLGADYILDSMAVFNLAFSVTGNENRCTQQADIYYRNEAAGAGNNVNDADAAFDATGYTLLGTAGVQTFTQTTGGDTAIEPDIVSFGGVAARYVAIKVNSTYGSGNCGLAEVLFFQDSGADPVLEVAGGTPDPDFAFDNVFGPASPTRTVQYTNNSPGGNTITIQSVAVSDDGGGVFGSPTVTYSGTNVLANGDTMSIEVPVNIGGSGAAAGILDIDTTSSGGIVDIDFNDRSVALTATLIESGTKLNDNGSFASGLTGWGGNSIAVEPGVAPGSSSGARVRGAGDPSGITSSSAFQAGGVPDGASDWEFSAYFTPAAASEFGDYAGTTIPSADGLFTDRTFQWVLLSADTPRPDDGNPDIGFDDSVMANSIVNIAYLPDGNTTGGTPDFYVFDGSSGPNGTWVATGIGAIAGSIDADDDGNLDGTTDTLNVYRLTVTGSGFGTASAAYDVSVAKVVGPDSFTSASAAGRTEFHTVDGSGNAETPAAHGFCTNDVSTTSNFGDGTDQGLCSPFWIDDVCLFNIAAPDPSLTVANTPASIVVSTPATSGTSSFSIRNDGSATNLNIDSVSLTGGTGFSVISPSIPVVIAPGTLQEFVIEWDSATASNINLETTTITVEDTGNSLSGEVSLKAGLAFGGFVVLDYNDHVLGNMADAGNANTGIGFTEPLWNTGTGTQIVVAGDLDTTTVPGYSVPVNGTPQSQSTNNTVGRAQERQIDLGTGINPVWFSFIASAPSSAGRIGFGLNNNGVTSANPRLLWLNNGVRFLGGGFDITTPFAATADPTVFVGRITINESPGGEDRIEVWPGVTDMSSIAGLGAPALNISGSNIFGDGLTRLNPTAYGATGVDAPIIDNLRLSDLAESAAFDVIRTGITPVIDPVLEVDGGSADPDFNHGNVFGTGSSSRAVTFVNTSDSGSETITIESVTLTDDAGGVFSLGTLPGLPLVLNNGESISIEVNATTAESGVFAGEIEIDTLSTGLFDPNNNDRVLPLSVAFYLDGEKLNDNGFFDAGLGGWGGGSATAPGIAPGSLDGARVIGAGDPSGGFSASLFQATGIPDGAPDWEFTAFFTPASSTVFGDYAGTTISAADGAFTDRTFQWVLLGAEHPRPDDGAPDIGFDDTVMANAIVNIAYLPDGNTSGGTPDFYVFDGTAGANGTWVATGIGAIAGSIDADDDGDPSNGIGDGDLDDTTDTLNVYRLRVVGTSFGTVAASYDVSVSKVVGPDTFPGGSATGRTEFHGLDGTSNTPAAHGFATNDVSTTSNFGDGTDQGITTPFWVDDVCFFAGSAPDPNLVLLGVPDVLSAFAPDIASTTAVFIRNDGESLGLDVSSITLTGTGFSAVTSPALPTTLAAGALQQVDLTFDSAAIAPDTAAITQLTVDSNDPLEPSVTRTISGAVTSFSKLLANWDFEVGGFDTSTDTFAVWEETITPESAIAVPGLLAGSTTAVHLQPAGGNVQIRQVLGSPVNDFMVEFPFAYLEAAGRDFNFLIEAAGAGQINIRYQSNQWWAFNNVTGTTWESIISMAGSPLLASVDGNSDGSLDDAGAGDVKNVYVARVTGSGWGTASPTFQLEILDETATTVLGDSGPGIAKLQNSAPTEGGADAFVGTTAFGGVVGTWFDDICFSGSLTPPALIITAFTIDPSTGIGSVTFDSVDGTSYELRASNDVNDADPFSANLITSGAGTGASTTFNFTDPGAVGQPVRTYRIEAP